MLIPVLIVFIALYVLMLIFADYRMWFALAAAAVYIIMGVVAPGEAPGAVNWNVIMMIAGTMGVVSMFTESGMPMRLADTIINRVPDVRWAVVMLSVFSGVVSAFVDNVATVLMLAPVCLALCRQLEINPVPVLVSVAVSSNLQGAATLVGDTTSILLGGYAGMNFMDFIWWQGRPSIFWAVELGALGTVFILLWLFRDQKGIKIATSERTQVDDYFPSILMTGIVVLLIIASFIPGTPDNINGMICCSLCVIGLIRNSIKYRSLGSLKLVAKEFDWATVLMLCGLFIVIRGIQNAGIIDIIANFFAGLGGGNIFLLYTIIVFGSVILSAFIDNIPYVAAMLPVLQSVSVRLGCDPVLLYFGLLTGATLGGNITPFGASANIAGIGILRKEGYTVTNGDFFRIGVPFTMTAVLIGYAFIWAFWA